MLKPDAVNLRVKLWKLYFPDDKKYIIPKFGLNFLKNEATKDKKFLLICGFENFDKFYIRVDILERFFLVTYPEASKSYNRNINCNFSSLLPGPNMYNKEM